MSQQGPLHVQDSSNTVTSVTGTAPIEVNGVSGVPETGAVTISIAGSGFVDSVSGTANRITASPITGNVVIDIASNYVGQTSLTTLGIISTGTWNGSTILGQYGGTGIANTGRTIDLGSFTTGYVLTSDSSGNATWQPNAALGGVTSISATAPLTVSASTGAVTVALTTPLALNYGGTNAALTASNGGIFYSTSSAGAILGGTPTANQALLSGSSSAPSWSTATYPATTTVNQLLYSSSSNVIGGITAANNGVLISGTSGIPSWLAAGTTGQVLIATTGNPASWGALSGITVTSISATAPLTVSASTGAVTIALTTPLALNYGGTNASLTASNGGIFYSTASAGAILSGTATASQVLLSGSSSSPAWSTATYPSTTTVNQLLYSSSSNVIGGVGAANNGVLISGTGGIPSWLGAGTTGQVLIATTSNPASWGTLSGIAVTSITGTANQVLANGTTGSAQTGAVTLTLPQSIATTSSVQFSHLGIGGAPSSVLIEATQSGSQGTIMHLTGTTTSSGPGLLIDATYNSFGASAPNLINFSPTISGNFGVSTTLSALSVSLNLSAVTGSGSSANVATFNGTNFAGFFGRAFTVYITTSSNATLTNGALYSDNMTIGAVASPPSGGLLVSGNTSIGSTSAASLFNVGSSNQFQINTSGVVTSGTWNGSLISGQYGGTGVANTGLTITLSSGATGKILASDSSGNGTWSTLSSIAVTSISGTSHQITASASTGSVTLSLPNGISIGSYQATSPPTGGMILPARVGIGTTTPGSTNLLDVAAGVAIGSSYAGTNAPTNGLIVQGSTTIGTSTATASALLTMSSTTQGFLPPSMTTTQKNAISSPAAGLVVYDSVQADVEFWNGSAWIGTTTSGVVSIAGTTNQIVVSASTGSVTLSFPATGGLSVGSYQATSPPTGGMILPGIVGIGISSPSSNSQMNIQTAGPYAILHNGNMTSEDSGTGTGSQVGYLCQANFFPTLGASSCASIDLNPSFIAPSTKTISSASAILITNTLSSNVATISTVYGLWIQAGSTSTGTVSKAYGTYINQPIHGTEKHAHWVHGNDSAGASNGCYYLSGLDGAIVGDDGGRGTAFYNNVSISPTTTSRDGIGIFNIPSVTVHSSNQVNNAVGIYSSLLLNSSTTGTILNVFGLWIDSGNATGGTTVNSGYGGYFSNPAAGTTKCAIYGDTGSIGYTATSPTSSGLLVRGNLGVGLSNPTHQLQVGNDDAAKTTTATWTVTSDVRIKQNIVPVSGALAMINRLNPVTFQYIPEFLADHPEIDASTTFYGFIADDVEKVLPSCVSVGDGAVYNGAYVEFLKSLVAPTPSSPQSTSAAISPPPQPVISNLKTLNIHNIHILTVKAMQEASAQLTQALSQIAAMQVQLSSLAASVKALTPAALANLK